MWFFLNRAQLHASDYLPFESYNIADDENKKENIYFIWAEDRCTLTPEIRELLDVEYPSSEKQQITIFSVHL